MVVKTTVLLSPPGRGKVCSIDQFVRSVRGAAKATVIVIAGQIMFGALLDFAGAGMTNIAPSLLGIALVVLGMWVGYRSKLEAPPAAIPRQEQLASAPGR